MYTSTTNNLTITTTGDTTIIVINGREYPQLDMDINQRRYVNPCENCMNNPMNNPFASGFCNCTLPYINNPIY